MKYGDEILQQLRLSVAFAETKDFSVSTLDDRCHERRVLCRGDGEKDLRSENCDGYQMFRHSVRCLAEKQGFPEAA
jgi:hypothetical protein